MGAPYSAPPFWLFYPVLVALPLWGFLCGRVRMKIVGAFLLPLPYLVWAIYSPGLFSDMGAVSSFLFYSLLFMSPSYAVGLFSARTRRRKAEEVAPNLKKKLTLSVNVLLRFLLFIVYVAAITVSVQSYFRHGFPSGYIITAIVVAAATIPYVLVLRKARMIPWNLWCQKIKNSSVRLMLSVWTSMRTRLSAPEPRLL